MNLTEIQKHIDDFESHYRYDATFMRELLELSPVGFNRFQDFIPLASHRERLSPDNYWAAKLAAMQAEDCGDCLQLNVRMALEAGVARSKVEAIIYNIDALDGDLRDVHAFASTVAKSIEPDAKLQSRIEARFDKGDLLELGLCIASAKVFPTVKRAVGYTRHCSLVDIEM